MANQGSRPNNAMRWNTIPLYAPVADAASSVIDVSFTAVWETTFYARTFKLDVATNNTFTSYVAGFQDLDVGNVTSYSVTGLSGNTTYYYRVRASDMIGEGSNSNTISVTTKPTAPTIASVGISTSGGDICSSGVWLVTYSWTTNNPDDTDYQIDIDFADNAAGDNFSSLVTNQTTNSSNYQENTGIEGNVASNPPLQTFYRVGRIKVIRKSDSALLSHSDTSQVSLTYGSDNCT